MTFSDNADIRRGRARRRGRTTGIAAGGAGIGVLAFFLISQLFGVDLSALGGLGGLGGPGAQQPGDALTQCETGADANENTDCRMKGAAAALDVYWAEELPRRGAQYHSPAGIELFSGQVSTGCGTASSAVGPFYCPPDEGIYIDTGFFDDLRSRFGAAGGPTAELYIVAHEWGHHIQNITGIMAAADRRQSGPTSDSVRLEVQADCFAGAWIGAASTVEDENGVTFLEPVSDDQLRRAIDAAAAVGDDRIQEQASGQVQPESWTHGSAEQRQGWFLAGYRNGPAACDTFSVSGEQL